MLDGVQDKSIYPSDFFIDLVFKDGEGEMPKEDKDKLWVQIAQNCESRRKATDKKNNAVEELKGSEHTEAEPEFVIEAPTADDIENYYIADDKMEGEDRQASSLEQEAIKMHKELLEDDEDKKETTSESKKEANAAKNEEETKEKTHSDKVEAMEGTGKREGRRRKGSADKEKKEQPEESKKAETERPDDDDDQNLDLYCSNIKTLINSNR